MKKRLSKALSMFLVFTFLLGLVPGSPFMHLQAVSAAKVVEQPSEYEFEILRDSSSSLAPEVSPTIIDENHQDTSQATETIQATEEAQAPLPPLPTPKTEPQVTSDIPEPTEADIRYLSIVTNNTLYSQLSTEDAAFLSDYTGVSTAAFAELAAEDFSLSNSVTYGNLANEFGCTLSSVVALAPDEETCRELRTQLTLYLSLLHETRIGTVLDTELRSYLLEGYTYTQIKNAYGVSQSFNIALSDLLTAAEGVMPPELTTAEADAIQAFAAELGVSASAIATYAVSAGLTAEELAGHMDEISINSSALMMDANDAPIFPMETTQSPEDTYLGAPYVYKSNENEQVALNSGALMYEHADYVLPGVNGLDLVIGRRYNSQEAALYQPTVVGTPVTKRVYYVIGGAKASYNRPGIGSGSWSYYDESYDDGPFSTKSAAESCFAGWPSGSRSFPNFDGAGTTLILNYYKIIVYDTIPAGYSESSSKKPSEYQNKLWGLGQGWSFQFSSIESENGYSYLHLPRGSTYQIDWDKPGSHLKDYQLNDLTFIKNCQEFSNGVVTSEYRLTDQAGRREYFSRDGKLIGIKDRFDNKITFVHSTYNGYPRIVITDTVGRQTTISGKATSGGHTMTVALPNNITLSYQVKNVASRENYKVLETYVDAVGSTTQFSYTLQNAGFDVLSKSTSAANNEYLNLTSITHPTGARSVYTYEMADRNLGSRGLTKIYRLASRVDQMGVSTTNRLNYTYSANDCSGYPALHDSESLPNSFTYSATVTNSVGLTSITTFNNKHLQVKSELRSGLEKLQTTDMNYNDNDLSILEKTSRYSSGNQTSPLVSIIARDYDGKGNVTAEWSALAEGNTSNVEHKTTYTYDSTYGLLLSKTYKIDSATTVELRNTLDTGKKNVVRADAYVNNTLKGRTEYSYNSSGTMSGMTLFRNGVSTYDQVTFTYDRGAYLSAEIHSGIKTADNGMAAATPGQPAGTIAMTYSYDTLGRMITSKDGNGQRTSYAYDALGSVTKITKLDNATVVYTRNYTANNVVVTDENGARFKYTYTPLGLEFETVDVQTGRVLARKEYDSSSRLLRSSDFVYSSATEYSYDVLGRTTAETIKAGSTTLAQTLYSYDDAANSGLYQKVTKTIVGDADAPSMITTQYADRTGNVVKTGKILNGTELIDTFAYDYMGNCTQSKSAYTAGVGGAFTTKTTYDYAGRPTGTTNALNQTVTTGYDWQGNKISATDPKGNITLYTYDALGRLLTQSAPFDEAGAATSYAVTRYSYDPGGNVTARAVKNNAPGAVESWTSTEYAYNAMNQLVQVTSHADATHPSYTQYYYDKAGNVLRMYVGQATPLTITGLDQVSGTVDNVTKYTYDIYGNQSSMTDPLGKTETYTCDLNGLPLTKVDRNGSVTSYTYDGMGRPLSQRVMTSGGIPDGAISYTYTLTGQKRSETDGRQTATYTYDSLGRVLAEAMEGTVKTYSYNSADLRTAFILKVNGVQKLSNTYAYDALGRLVEVSGSGVNAVYGYDANGNQSYVQYGNGLREEYTYNQANLVTQVANKNGSTVLSRFSYGYLLDGNQSTKTELDGTVTGYTYDGLGQLLVEDAVKNGTTVRKYSYAYDNRNNRISIATIPHEGLQAEYIYDKANRQLETIGFEHFVGKTATYTYDANGNRLTSTAIESEDPPVELSEDLSAFGLESGIVWEYTYDGFNRQIGVASSGHTNTYTYGPGGLRIGKTVDGKGTQYVWDAGQLVYQSVCGESFDAPPPIYKCVIPSWGLVYEGQSLGLEYGKTYWLEVDGVVTECVAGDEPSDPNEPPMYQDGPPVYLSAGGVEIRDFQGVTVNELNINGGAGRTVQIYADNPAYGGSAKETVYIRGLNLIASVSEETSYYLYNAHGDVVQLTDQVGAVTHEYKYDAFGVELNPGASDANPFRYCGEQYDSETGSIYLRARYYDVQNGRFTTEDTHWNPGNMIYGDNPKKFNERGENDPLGLNTYTYVPDNAAIRQSGNLYGYCGGNPLMYTDPTGQAWYHWVIGGVIVVAAAAAVVVTAGGALPAMYAVGAVASGIAAGSTATTVAAGAFIGSAAVYGTLAAGAALSSKSIHEFNAKGNWGTVAFTAGGLLVGGAQGYTLYQNNKITIVGKGSTGRTEASSLNEQLAMKQVYSNPLQGATRVSIVMSDARWLASDGWVKMQNIVTISNGTKINIHFVYNTITKVFDDFKFK